MCQVVLPLFQDLFHNGQVFQDMLLAEYCLTWGNFQLQPNLDQCLLRAHPKSSAPVAWKRSMVLAAVLADYF